MGHLLRPSYGSFPHHLAQGFSGSDVNGIYLLNPVERRIPPPGQRELPDMHRFRVVLRYQQPIERQRKDRHPNLSGTLR